MAKRCQAYIDGGWCDASDGATFDNHNPADTREPMTVHPACTVDDAERAVAAAARALPSWSALTGAARGEFLYRAAGILDRRSEEVAQALADEEGKTLVEARGETRRGVVILRYYANEGMMPVGEVIPSTFGATTLCYTQRVPLGVVGLITPWNFPVAIPLWKAAPAMVYGNTVVLKPSPASPYTATLIAEVLEEAKLPPGVFNLVQGMGRPVGEAIVESPRVAGVSFTGSHGIGTKIAAACAARGKRYQTEMGGKNPIIVLEDAHLDQAASLAVNGAMKSTGHKCTATGRAIVVESVAEEFTRLVVEKAKAIRVGDPRKPATDMGPVINKKQFDTIMNYVAIAMEEGGEILCGGEPITGGECAHGYFFAPTVIRGVPPQGRVAQEEIFGPVLPIFRVRDFDAAIEMANDVRFGLSASLCTGNLNRAIEYTKVMQAGLVRVNAETAGVEPHAPFGGFKASGSFVREQGQAAKDFYTQIQTVYMEPKREG